MSIEYPDAVDEMFTTVKAMIDDSTDIIGYIPEVRWQGVPVARKTSPDKFWARASQMVVTENQASLANENDTRKWETIGLLYVQIFAPRNQPGSADKARLLADKIRDAFRQSSLSGEIWYRKQKVVQLPETEQSYPFNIVIEFYYETLRSKTFAGVLPTPGGDTDMPSLIHDVKASAGLNAVNVKSGAGLFMGWKLFNNSPVPIYIKLYNKSSVPVVGTDVPSQVIAIQAGTSDAFSIQGGISYSIGIARGITKGESDTDTTPLSDGDCVGTLFYQ